MNLIQQRGSCLADRGCLRTRQTSGRWKRHNQDVSFHVPCQTRQSIAELVRVRLYGTRQIALPFRAQREPILGKHQPTSRRTHTVSTSPQMSSLIIGRPRMSAPEECRPRRWYLSAWTLHKPIGQLESFCAELPTPSPSAIEASGRGGGGRLA
jgi:hypothetical protein